MKNRFKEVINAPINLEIVKITAIVGGWVYLFNYLDEERILAVRYIISIMVSVLLFAMYKVWEKHRKNRNEKQ